MQERELSINLLDRRYSRRDLLKGAVFIVGGGLISEACFQDKEELPVPDKKYKLLWSKFSEGHFLVNENSLYLGGPSKEIVSIVDPKEIVKVDPETGKQFWQTYYNARIIGFHDDKILISPGDRFVAIDTNSGQIKWELMGKFENEFALTPNQKIFLISTIEQSNVAHIVNPKTGIVEQEKVVGRIDLSFPDNKDQQWIPAHPIPRVLPTSHYVITTLDDTATYFIRLSDFKRIRRPFSLSITSNGNVGLFQDYDSKHWETPWANVYEYPEYEPSKQAVAIDLETEEILWTKSHVSVTGIEDSRVICGASERFYNDDIVAFDLYSGEEVSLPPIAKEKKLERDLADKLGFRTVLIWSDNDLMITSELEGIYFDHLTVRDVKTQNLLSKVRLSTKHIFIDPATAAYNDKILIGVGGDLFEFDKNSKALRLENSYEEIINLGILNDLLLVENKFLDYSKTGRAMHSFEVICYKLA